MATAHDFVKEDLQLESQTGRVGIQILATLVGGALLACSLIAYFLTPRYGSDFHTTILAMLAAILLGAPLVWVALKDMAHGHMHMNELVALAVIAAFAIGKYQEAAAIAFFMIISVLIENRTALGARASIESLVRITPTRAHRLTDDGADTEVDAADLRPGDRVRVRPGDNIPADGRILDGSSTVNQANITGESLPADKEAGDEVFGGTINLTGVMTIQVTMAGADATLGRVKQMILQAEATRIPIMRMIDRYAGWYTPTVLMLVAIVWIFSQQSGHGAEDAWQRAIAMLVIACPCPLILATPTAMVAALSAAARLGVLVKSVIDLESARSLTAIVFDKTGTLTTGELEVVRLKPADGIEGVDLLQAAAALEQNSRHPVARSVVRVARKARLTLAAAEGFSETPGRGVSASVEGRPIHVGRADWLCDNTRVGLTDYQKQRIQAAQSSPEAEGLSVLFVVRDGQLLGWIGLMDNTRPEAAAAVDDLRNLGLKRLIIVTGDRKNVAKRVADEMHTDYEAEVLPQQKLEIVADLKQRGHRVAVVGDGVNDAPALAAGDVSIAMGAAGSDVAIHSASIALMNNNLNRIPFLVRLSRRTSGVIKQNLIIGFVFILVFEILAAAGFVTPIQAAVLHVVAGLIVVFNSARLVRSGEEIEHAEAGVLAEREQRPTPQDRQDGVQHEPDDAAVDPALA